MTALNMQKNTLPRIRDILAKPQMYNVFQGLVRGKAFYQYYIHEWMKPSEHFKVLDIGCGTAEILNYLPNVEYFGFDMNQSYITYAKKRYSSRNKFKCQRVDETTLKGLGKFDLVMANGIIHHLDDDESIKLFHLVESALNDTGRFVSFDGCYEPGQSSIARYLLDGDRGEYVRNKGQYLTLAGSVFDDIKTDCRHDILRVPYTLLFMECRISG